MAKTHSNFTPVLLGSSRALALSALFLATACGGGQKKVEDPVDPPLLDQPSETEQAPSNAQVAAGRDAIQAKDFAKAETILAKAVADSPEDPQASFYHGVALENLERFDDATSAYSRAIELQPKLIDASVNLSALLLDLEKVDEALAVIDKALEMVPEDMPLKANRALALLQLGKPEAVAAYAELVKAKPENIDFRFNHATALLITGKEAEGLAALKEIKTDDIGLLSDMESVYLKLKKPDECIALWDAALERNNSVEGLAHRARCRLFKKDAEGAERDLRASIALDEEASIGHFYLASLLRKNGKTDEAKKHYEAAAKKDDDFGNAAKAALSKM